MAEYASKGVGTGALTTGIIGTSLAGLLALNNGEGGLLGGLFGNNGRMAGLMAENTQLKSQVYTDRQVKDVNAEICGLRQEVTRQGAAIECLSVRTDERFAAAEKIAALQQEVTDGKIARVADSANCGISALQASLSCLQNTVNGITKSFVPASSVTPFPAPMPFPYQPVMEPTYQQPVTATSASTGA